MSYSSIRASERATIHKPLVSCGMARPETLCVALARSGIALTEFTPKLQCKPNYNARRGRTFQRSEGDPVSFLRMREGKHAAGRSRTRRQVRGRLRKSFAQLTTPRVREYLNPYVKLKTNA